MKPYILFTWEQYYPRGGFNDLRGRFDTMAEAIEVGDVFVKGDGLKRYQVYDVVNEVVVAEEHGVYE